jgi:hypothetical protein
MWCSPLAAASARYHLGYWFALCLGSIGCCSARTQLIAPTGVSIAVEAAFYLSNYLSRCFCFRHGRHRLLLGASS